VTQKQYRRLADLARSMPPGAIRAAADLCDGHGIVRPEALVDAGLPVEVVAHLTRTHRSDGSPKGTLFVDGRPVESLTGVYGLDALRFLAAALGVEYRDAIGRGFEAQNIKAALAVHLSATPTPAPANSRAPATRPVE